MCWEVKNPTHSFESRFLLLTWFPNIFLFSQTPTWWWWWWWTKPQSCAKVLHSMHSHDCACAFCASCNMCAYVCNKPSYAFSIMKNVCVCDVTLWCVYSLIKKFLFEIFPKVQCTYKEFPGHWSCLETLMRAERCTCVYRCIWTTKRQNWKSEDGYTYYDNSL